jgi:hypothetical protein
MMTDNGRFRLAAIQAAAVPFDREASTWQTHALSDGNALTKLDPNQRRSRPQSACSACPV